MGMARKRKLRERVRKQARQQDRLDAVRDRLLAALGLDETYRLLPEWLREIFLLKMKPGIEVAAAEGHDDDPEIQALVRRIRRQILDPFDLELDGRPFLVSFDDCARGLWCILEGFRFLNRVARTCWSSEVRRLAPLLERLNQRLNDDHFQSELDNRLAWMEATLIETINERFRIDGRMLSMQWTPAMKPEGTPYRRLEIRAHAARPIRLGPRGDSRLAYPCTRSEFCNGLMPVRWNPRRLGITSSESGSADLPVYISPHAISRFDERLPIDCGDYSLHNLILEGLRSPRPIAGRDGAWLIPVEPVMGRIGYLVAQVLPDYVLIKTFLFLTMRGTPESERLMTGLGVFRADVERFELDRCKTWIDSDITQDPLIRRVLSNCGCGHLLTFLADDRHVPWLHRHGEQLKQTLALREVEGGYVVGRKWVRWSESDLRVCS